MRRAERGFLGGVLVLLGGSVMAQALGLITTPLLSRLFTPEAFGVLAVFTAVTSVLGVVATGRYELGVTLPNDDRDASSVLLLALAIAVVVALASLLLVALLGPWSARALNEPAVAPWLWLVPPVVLAAGVQQTFNYWATRCGHFATLAANRLAQALVATGSQLALGWLGLLAMGGLILGQTLGALFGAIFLAGVLVARDGAKLRSGAVGARIHAVAREYAGLPRHALQTNLLNALSRSYLPVLLTGTFGAATAGFVMLIERLLARPVGVLVESVWQVSHGRLPRLAPPEQLRLLRRVHRLTALLSGFPLVVSVWFADLAPVFLGERWGGLERFVGPLAVMLYANAISNATSYFAAFQRYRAESVANIVLIGGRVAAITVGAVWLDAEGTVALYAGLSTLVYLGINTYWGLVLRVVGRFAWQGLLGVAVGVALTALIALAAGVSTVLGIVAFGVTGVVYLALVVREVGRLRGSPDGPDWIEPPP